MAGLDDYQFYTNLKDKDSPFWQKVSTHNLEEPTNRPSTLPTTLKTEDKYLSRSKINTLSDANQFDAGMEKYTEISITLINVCAENLISHPFTVLRRQCQVNVSSQRYHLQPFTLLPALYHIQNNQGFSALWKGLGSVLTVRGVTLALEDFLSKFTPWPKEVSPHSSLKTIGQHLLLKCFSVALVTPFYSASLVETVQSEITSERPGVFDIFKEGLYRIMSFTQPQTGRMLPVWLLIVPTVVHGVSQYVISTVVSTMASQVLRSWQKYAEKKRGAICRDPTVGETSIRLQASFIGRFAADFLLFPFETILHRLHLQGTRTIIDSLDAGYEVKPILTRYEGFFDCAATTVRDEGVLGLFKGIGSLGLQYLAYGIMIKFAHVLISDVVAFVVNKDLPRIKPEADVKPLVSPGLAYPPVASAASGSSSSLHASPMHSTRPRRHPHTGSVDLADLDFANEFIDIGDMGPREDRREQPFHRFEFDSYGRESDINDKY